MAPALKASILDRIAAEDPGEHAQELLDISREEASVKGWLRGPHTPSEIDRLLDTSDWIPVRRFAVVQNSRTRPIDDLRPERCCCESGGVAVACRSAHGFQLLYSTQIFPFCCISFYIANFHAWILLLDFHVEHFTGQFWHAVKYSGHSKHF